MKNSICSNSLLSLAVLGSVALAPGVVRGDERLFTYTYEAEVLPKGGLEFEQWITHRRGKEANQVFSAWDFREELEYGITDKLTTAGYLNFRQTHNTAETPVNEFEFKGISSEWKYQILNPQTQPFGFLVYGEATYSGDELELEEKLVFQKNFGQKWTVALNATVEQEWEFEPDETERELKFEVSAGLSYRLSENWAIGLEGRNVRVFPDFGSEKHSGWFAGPAIHYGSSRWWATLTVMPQIAGRPDTRSGLNVDEFERIQVRLIAGYNF